MRWFCFSLRWRSRKRLDRIDATCYGCITPNFPRRRGWKTPLKEHRLYLQLVVLKMLLTMLWHRLKFPAPRWVKLTGAPRGARPATHGLA